jgi:hypothetical protein
VASALRGKRGQEALREIRDALDAMPEKKLAAHSLKCDEGVCTLGVLGEKRGLDLASLEDAPREKVAKAFGIAEAMAAEIMFMNDEGPYWSGRETPEKRWQYMRNWIEGQIREEN